MLSPAMAAHIRLANEQDAASIRRIYAPYVLETAISFETAPPSEDQMRQRLAAVLQTLPWLLCENEGDVLGFAYASRHRERHAYRWAVDVAVYVDSSYHRSGIGRGLYCSLLPMLSALGYYQAYAGIALPNESSVGLHEAMGFKRLAVYPSVGFKLGRWHDVGWWLLTLQEPVREPAEPRPLTELAETSEFAAFLAAGEPFLRI
jgi:L-amino acid N-acyltransferase YncA